MAKDWVAMYLVALKYDVERELDKNPFLSESLGSYRNKFITWCASQRLVYQDDLEDEIKDFTEKFISKRLYNIDVKLWMKMRAEIFVRDDFICKYCGRRGGKLEADHIIPMSKGGTNDMDNLATSCRKCNRQKKDKTLEEFIKWSESQ